MSDLKKIAVYGSLKQGFGNHRLLSNSKFLGADVIPSGYTMYSLGGFPAIVEGGSNPLLVEVYEVDRNTLIQLDGLEGHPNWYCRKPLATKYGDAEVYVMPAHKMRNNTHIVEDGIWRQPMYNW